MTKTFKVTSVMAVDYVCEIEMPEGSTDAEIIAAAEEAANWDVDRHADIESTDQYLINDRLI